MSLTCQVNTGVGRSSASVPFPTASWPEAEGSAKLPLFQLPGNIKPATPACPSFLLHGESDLKVCARNPGRHPPEGATQVLVRLQARETRSLQRLAHNAPRALDTCTNPPTPPPALRPGLTPAFHGPPRQLPCCHHTGPLTWPHSSTFLCAIPLAISACGNPFLRPISTTKCHLPWFPHTVRLSKAHSTLYLGGWASVACLGHLCALDEGSASVIQHGIPSTAAAHGAPEPWPGCSTPALAASYLQS